MKNLSLTQELDAFFVWLRKSSEEYWAIVEINPNIYGFQIQTGTKWLRGLSKKEIDTYEWTMGFEFPAIYSIFLRNMNGTNKPTKNIYAESGEPYHYSVGYYSFPRDLDLVKAKIAWILDVFKLTAEDIEQMNIPHIMPITEHRFLVMDRCELNPVLSMYEDDVILYAPSLPQFLVSEIFQEGAQERTEQAKWLLKLGKVPVNFKVKFWLD